VTLIQIYESMKSLGEEVKDTEFTPSELTRFIRSLIGNVDSRVSTTRDSNVDLDQIIIGGLYDPHDDEAGAKSITIYVTYNPDQKTIKIADIDWPQVCIDLIECSGHEIVHQRQYRARDFDIGSTMFVSGNDDEHMQNDQNYLGNPDEIDAYAYSIAVEIYLKHRPPKLNSKYMSQTAMYKAYKNAFGAEHSIVNQLVKLTVDYYIQLSSLPV